MPQTIHRGIKSLIDEANAEIETLSAAEAIKAAKRLIRNLDVVCNETIEIPGSTLRVAPE